MVVFVQISFDGEQNSLPILAGLGEFWEMCQIAKTGKEAKETGVL